MNLTEVRNLFDIPEDVSYLNFASLSPQLRSVTSGGIQALQKKAAPWKIQAPDWFSGGEELRVHAARVINAAADDIALIASVSYGISIAAANIPVSKGQQIVVMDEEYPSNYYAWRELSKASGAEVLTVKKGEVSWTEALLESISSSTAIVAIANCHWTNGAMVDLVQISEKTRSVGAALVIDASQAMGVYPIDVEAIQPDFLVSVGYKWLLGPYGLGYLYASPKWQKEGRPIEYSWRSKSGSENFAALVNYRDEYQPGARRFDTGELPGFIHAPMSIEALKQLNAWGVPAIQFVLAGLTREVARQASSMGLSFPAGAEQAGHMIGINLPGGIPEALKEELNKEKIYVGYRGKGIRISPYLYTTMDDIDRLMQVIRRHI